MSGSLDGPIGSTWQSWVLRWGSLLTDCCPIDSGNMHSFPNYAMPESRAECINPPVPGLAVTKIMVDMLEPKPDDILMEIGTGTGSQTVIFQKHFKEVHSVELQQKYRIVENQPLGPHVYLSYGDGARGLPDAAPFDAIVVTCGTKEIPPAWIDQLKDGGRMVVPIGTPECQKLTLFRKLGGHLIPSRISAYTRFVMMEKENHVSK